MTQVKEHRRKMAEVRNEINRATGFRKKDLWRQYNRMAKELKEYQTYQRAAR